MRELNRKAGRAGDFAHRAKAMLASTTDACKAVPDEPAYTTVYALVFKAKVAARDAAWAAGHHAREAAHTAHIARMKRAMELAGLDPNPEAVLTDVLKARSIGICPLGWVLMRRNMTLDPAKMDHAQLGWALRDHQLTTQRGVALRSAALAELARRRAIRRANLPVPL